MLHLLLPLTLALNGAVASVLPRAPLQILIGNDDGRVQHPCYCPLSTHYLLSQDGQLPTFVPFTIRSTKPGLM